MNTLSQAVLAARWLFLSTLAVHYWKVAIKFHIHHRANCASSIGRWFLGRSVGRSVGCPNSRPFSAGSLSCPFSYPSTASTARLVCRASPQSSTRGSYLNLTVGPSIQPLLPTDNASVSSHLFVPLSAADSAIHPSTHRFLRARRKWHLRSNTQILYLLAGS